jgi:uncharacterized protein YijF (DUF1287 family)
MRSVDTRPGIARRTLLAAPALLLATPAQAAPSRERFAAAALRQVGVTFFYDPAYRRIGYPGGDVPRFTGVCADVPVRAARDALGLDLQKLVHEDMQRAFDAYPSRRRWGMQHPDANIDHRRVPNLEAFWTRAGAGLWRAKAPVAGDAFPAPLEPGDLVTWLLPGGYPHVAVVTRGGQDPHVVHNIGAGVRTARLAELAGARAVGHFRWPGPV